jgi:hypothetical protein
MEPSFPAITNCEAGKCIYNHSGQCRTMAINVGGPEPLCDTYSAIGKKGGYNDLVAKVGACKVDTCIHNKLLECIAAGVDVVNVGNRPECATYQERV